jgi:uncharacterized protein YndB with AHSA1/START domain
MNLLLSLSVALSLFSGQAPDAKTFVVHEAVVSAPFALVWEAFTTKKGLESWMVAHAEIDLQVGGKMLTHYSKDGKIGDDGTIENTILSFDPMRMMSIKATKPPANFPFKDAIKKMWTVIYFTAEEEQTRVKVISHGFTMDQDSQTMRGHFDAGNKFTLDKLMERFKKK